MALIRQQEKVRARSAAVVGSGSINPGAVEVTWQGAGPLLGRSASVVGSGATIVDVPAYQAPAWATIPTLTFVEGEAGEVSLATFLTEGNYATATLTASGLPDGVTIDSAGRKLVYDGIGAEVTATVATVTADDGYGDATDLTTMIVEDISGTAGVVLKKADVPSGSYLTASGVTGFQAEVKSRWPDGSARIAVVSWNDGTITPGTNRTITLRRSASEPTNVAVSLATFRASGFNGSIAFTAGATPGISGVAEGATVSVAFGTLVAGVPHRTWQSGPQCSEWHWRSPVGSDPTLVVWLYVRHYANGKTWARIGVENGYTKVTPQDGKRYRAVITLDGTLRYDTQSDADLVFPRYIGNNAAYGEAWYWPWAAGDPLAHSCRSRWTKSYWYDGSTQRAVCHDGLYWSATKMFPNYGYRNTPTAQFGLAAQASAPMRLRFASYDQKQAGSPMISHLPDHLYVLAPQGTSYQKLEYHSMVARAEEAGHRGASMRDENTNEIVVWSDRPNLYRQSTSDGNSISWANHPTNAVTDRAHDPLWGYTAYLATGDHFHLESLQMEATFLWLGMSYATTSRDGVKGLIFGYDEQTRAFAWTIRTFGAAAVCTPDIYDASNYHTRALVNFVNSVYYNAERQVAQFIDGSLTGSLAVYNAPNSIGRISSAVATNNMDYWETTPQYNILGEAPWQQNFCSVALAHIEYFEILTGSQQAMLTRLVTHALKFAINMLGAGDSTGWPYTHGGAFAIPQAKKINNVWTYSEDYSVLYGWYLEIYPGVPDQRTVALATPLGAPFLNITYAMVPESDPALGNGYTASPANWTGTTWGTLHGVLAAAAERGAPSGVTAARARLQSLTGPIDVVPAGAAGYAAHEAYFHANTQWAEVERT